MFNLYLGILSLIMDKVLTSLILLLMVFLFLLLCVSLFQEDMDAWLEEKVHDAKFMKKFILISLASLIVISAPKVSMYLGSREYQADKQELKVKLGMEDYHLVVKNKQNEIVYEKTGYFKYTKEKNQLTVTDLVDKSIEIVSVDDDMEIKVNIVNDK